MGHLSSHLELTTAGWIFSVGLVSIMKVQMVSMSVKFLMLMEELRLFMLGFTLDLFVSNFAALSHMYICLSTGTTRIMQCIV